MVKMRSPSFVPAGSVGITAAAAGMIELFCFPHRPEQSSSTPDMDMLILPPPDLYADFSME